MSLTYEPSSEPGCASGRRTETTQGQQKGLDSGNAGPQMAPTGDSPAGGGTQDSYSQPQTLNADA